MSVIVWCVRHAHLEMSGFLCPLTVHLQILFLHVCLFAQCVSVHYTVHATVCLPVHVYGTISEPQFFKDHQGFIRDTDHTKAKNTKSQIFIMLTQIIITLQINHNHIKHSLRERAFSTTLLSSIQKAFNSTHCASNLCCNANRIFLKYIHPTGIQRKDHFSDLTLCWRPCQRQRP